MVIYIKRINNPYSIKLLVNKDNKLPSNYEPNDLVSINSDYTIGMQFLRKIAKYNFEKMCEDAKKENLHITAVSTYRSYNYQRKLFQKYSQKYGLDYAKMCSAKEGHSEHQTGLAVDIADITGDYDHFSNTKEYNWMINNAYKYGFILRYPKYKTDITGYKFEPWHYRYVGKKMAKILFLNNKTLDE